MEHQSYERRRESVKRMMDLHDLGGILFFGFENIRYLCGFTGSDGALVITRRECYFLTDSRYWTQSEIEVKGAEIVHYKKKLDGLSSLLSDLRLKRVGFESPAVTFSFFHSLSQKLSSDTELIPVEDEIKNLRAIKDDEELALIRKAIDIASKAFEHILGSLKEGALEKEIALEMEFFMKHQGAETAGFDLIVASGNRSALPHGKASNKRIEKGDFILIDFGSKFEGYHSDQTRTMVCGDPSPDQKKVYQVVREAQTKAMEAVRPGVSIHEIDASAREHIRQMGYGEYFGHGTGHGLGLAVHEDPTVNGENKGVIQEGMVFTIEPGIYIPDWGGLRIEDMVLVTKEGSEVLTHLPRELKVIT